MWFNGIRLLGLLGCLETWPRLYLLQSSLRRRVRPEGCELELVSAVGKRLRSISTMTAGMKSSESGGLTLI